MMVYIVIGSAILAGGVLLGVTAFVALISAWNALPIQRVEAPVLAERKVFDWERDWE